MIQEQNRLITADRIHNGHGWLPTGTVLEIAPDGVIMSTDKHNVEDAEVFNGVLAPGFVNAHCHIELSHMKGVVPEDTGLIPFLGAIPAQRNNFSEEEKQAARIKAVDKMRSNGIVAVGDIANSTETLDVRASGKLHIHTFVECIGFTQQFAHARLDFSASVFNAFAVQQVPDVVLRQTIIPHAPYSVSNTLFGLIDKFAPQSLISIHNQESTAEDEFYNQKTGPVLDLLTGLGIDPSFFNPSGKSSLQTYLPWLSPEHPMLMVHNTYTKEQDVLFAETRFPSISWCLCPNANWYIERQLPDVYMLMKHATNICIGTDSLASNHELSVLGELQMLQEKFPVLDWEVLLRWGTLNGAKALRMSDEIGSIEPGKKPGIICIKNLESDPAVTRII